MQETWVPFLVQEDPVEKEMAAHSRIIPNAYKNKIFLHVQKNFSSIHFYEYTLLVISFLLAFATSFLVISDVTSSL